MSIADAFREQALALPPKERASLARELILSLENGDFDSDVDQAWGNEAQRRSGAYAQGEDTAVDWRESVAQIRRSLAERRGS